MPPKGSRAKATVDAAPDKSDSAHKGTPSKLSDVVNNLLSEAEVTAGGSGLNIEENLKALATVAADDTFIEDGSDKELEIDAAKGISHLWSTAILCQNSLGKG
ncbi:unnamed protein product [Closterium sp. NIES-53]